MEFGESVHFLPLDISNRPNADARFQDGIWLGVRLGTEEYLVGTSSGILKVRSVKRKPIESRWDYRQVSAVMGTPWKPYNFTDEDQLRIAIPVMLDPIEPTERTQPEDPAPKRVLNYRKDLEKLGYTPSCPGCYAAKHHRPHRVHTDHCRERIQQAMTEDPLLSRRIAAAQDRENRWIVSQHEQQDSESKSIALDPEPLTIPVQLAQPDDVTQIPETIDVEIPGGDSNDFLHGSESRFGGRSIEPSDM